ncbi:Crp/Fnr family transcriptional regulator [Pararhizobium haloflavum]|uniref:Crp/Fnr family transcriptional regulator n=1 Tax=Pararhizobium haloflavum TaxID=2037914 RepID=UPI000C19C16F|nr:Crp/Fnr family transcriptional regulator [Pararhizobium haloflavum]
MATTIKSAASTAMSAAVQRLASNVLLNEEEVEFFEQLQVNRVAYRRGEEFVTDGEDFRLSFLIRDGWAIKYKMTKSGRRQIIGVCLPGDFIGLHINFQRRSIYSVAALTDLEVAIIEPIRILEVYQKYPVLASGLDWMTVRNFNILSEHNVSLGARPASQRILHFILEIWCRLMVVGAADDSGFRMLMTQEQIADTVGLSLVHTNKNLRKLQREGYISVDNGFITFNDKRKAVEFADFDERFLEQFQTRRLISAQIAPRETEEDELARMKASTGAPSKVAVKKGA